MICLNYMKREKRSSQKLFIVIGLLVVSIAAFAFITSKLVDQQTMDIGYLQTNPKKVSDNLLDQPNDLFNKATPLPTPDIPGLYESLINQGLDFNEAAIEYCKKLGTPSLYCQMRTVQNKQFTQYTLDYAVDDKYVYIARRAGGSEVIYHRFTWIDRKSFVYFENGYFKDKNGLYFDDYEGMGENPTKTITNVDVATVNLLSQRGTHFVFDKNHVYVGNPFLKEEKIIELDIVGGADPNTLKVTTNNDFDLEDNKNYYKSESWGLQITPKN